MATSRDEVHEAAAGRNNSVLAEFRSSIERSIAEAKQRGAVTFSVSVPDAVNSLQQDEIIAEYGKAGWTVTRGKQKNDHYLSFE